MLTIYVGVKTWTMRYPNVNLNSISLYKGVFIQPLEDKFFMLIKSFCLTLQPRLTRHPAWVNGSQTNVGNDKVSSLQRHVTNDLCGWTIRPLGLVSR